MSLAHRVVSAPLPHVPAMMESGLPEFEYQTWYGFFVPARTPREIVDLMNAEMRRALADKSISEPLLTQGAEASPSSPEELSRIMREEYGRWAKLIKAQNLKF